MNKATALWHNKEKSWHEEVILNTPSQEQVEVRSLFSLISIGTEKLLISEKISKNLARAMQVPHMQGNFNSSFTYGYSIVGEVVAGPSEIKGKVVHLMHPHQDRILTNIQDLSIVPECIAPRIATLASNMETAVNAVWDAHIEIGDKVLVIGYGTIGALTAGLLQNIAGVQLHIHDRNPYRIQIAKSQGLELFDEKAESDYDAVFNTTADQNMLKLGIDYTRIEGKTIELSWYGSRNVSINLGNHFHHGRKSIVSSQVSMIPLRKQPVWDFQKRKDLVFRLLSKINPKYLLDNSISFRDTPKFYSRLRKHGIEQIGTIINY